MSLFAELSRRNVFRVGVAYMATAWLVIQISETIFPLFGFSDTPARIAVIILAIGFVPVLALAWAFELTPEGLKKEQEVDRSTSIARQTGKKLDRVIIFVLALGLGYFAIDKFVLSVSREASIVEQARREGRADALLGSYGDQSIAVLAFDDMSPDRNQSHLSDGVAEQLLNLLTRVPELRVISRTSAFSYKGKNVQVSQIAEELNVTHVLEGSVQSSGNKVRISVQLVDARTDSQVWSNTFDRILDNIFAVQDEIAEAVVGNLKIELLGEVPRVRRSDPGAYTLFLRATANHDSDDAIKLLTEAVTIDAQFAQAWAELADRQLTQVLAGRVEPLAGFIAAAASANTALGLEENNPDALAVIGAIKIFRDRDLVGAAQFLRKAMRRSAAHPYLMRLYALLNLYFGRLESALEFMQMIIDRDPLEPSERILAANILVHMGDAGAARAMVDQVLETNPELVASKDIVLIQGRIELASGNPEKVLETIGTDQDEYTRTLTACALYELGQIDASDAVIEELQSRDLGFFAWATALAYGCRGDVDNSFEWLQRSYERGESLVILLRAAPEFAHLHNLPRWESLQDKLGVSDAHAESALTGVE